MIGVRFCEAIENTHAGHLPCFCLYCITGIDMIYNFAYNESTKCLRGDLMSWVERFFYVGLLFAFAYVVYDLLFGLKRKGEKKSG